MSAISPLFLSCTLFVAVSAGLASVQIALVDSQQIRDGNSKEFVHYGGNSPLDEYIELPSSQTPENIKKDIQISLSDLPGITIDPAYGTGKRVYLLDLAANADLIIEGEPLGSNSALTEGHRFIFSDYTVAVNRVIRADGFTVLPGQSIVVTRAGGILQVRGRTIRATIPKFELFRLGETYVFFLKFLPNGSFICREAAFNITSPEVKIYLGRTKEEVSISRAVFLDDINTAVSHFAKEGR